MDKTVRLQPEPGGEVLARFRQHGVTVDYAPLSDQDIEMLGESHDLTGPIEVSAVRLLVELEEKKAASKAEHRSMLHSMLRTFTGYSRGRR